MRRKTTGALCAITLAGVMAVSSLNVGYASWKTDITGKGSAVANGHWDVDVTNATIEFSDEGAGIEQQVVLTTLEEPETEIREEQPEEIKEEIQEEQETETEEKAVDAETEIEEEIEGPKTESEEAEGEAETETEAEEAEEESEVETKAGENEENPASVEEFSVRYVPIQMVGTGQNEETLETFADDSQKLVKVDSCGDSVEYPEVIFTLPGAWAKYTITVKNNGTVDAVLDEESVIKLETKSDQLKLNAPDLEGDVLSPGEECTFEFVVEVPEDITEKEALNAVGKLNVALKYVPPVVEEMPEPSHRNVSTTDNNEID